MADKVLKIEPEKDTHANWLTRDPTLGEDVTISGTSREFAGFVISTASPLGDIMVWGKGQTYAAAYAAGQFGPLSAEPQEITLTGNDISTANATTDLTVYETGGASALPAGSIVNVSWHDGDATYYHKFTSGGSFYNKFFPSGKAPGNPAAGTPTYAWTGHGTGGLSLRLRDSLTDWDVLTDGCFDKGSDGSGQTFIKYSNKEQYIRFVGDKSVSATNAYGSLYQGSYSFTFVLSFANAPSVSPGEVSWSTGAPWAGVSAITASSVNFRMYDVASRTALTETVTWDAHGEWPD